MPSTPSSGETRPDGGSAAEVLASRYRHLFVLPSTSILILYAAITTFILAFETRGSAGVVPFLLSFLVFILAAAGVSKALTLSDRGTIADFRRLSAVLVSGAVLWATFGACGRVFAWLAKSPGALDRAFLFGAFASAGLEFLIIDGVFTDRTWFAVCLSSVHPAATVAATIWVVSPSFLSNPVPPVLGVIAYVTFAGFTFVLKRRRTSGGHNVLSLFRAFMKTWVGGEASDLERIIADHSEEAEVTTKLLRFSSKNGNLFLVLPGIHPGPFHPVGSYDLPGVISRAFKGDGITLTLHRPGGHERNLVSRMETERYAAETLSFARTITISNPSVGIRGPIHDRIGKASVSAMALASDLVLTISFAPLGSDDLETPVETVLSESASKYGFNISVVDAHNSLGDDRKSVDTSDSGWDRLFQQMKQVEATPLRIGYAHSHESGLGSTDDLTENGMGLLMFETPNAKSVLVLADANNAVPSLRAETARALRPLGYELVEFCTSDSHNLAARGLTVSRGYRALGETTPVTQLVKLVADTAKLAETRLSPCDYGSGLLTSRVRVFGSGSLEEFASFTQSTSRLAKRYFSSATVVITALLAFSLVL